MALRKTLRENLRQLAVDLGSQDGDVFGPLGIYGDLDTELSKEAVKTLQLEIEDFQNRLKKAISDDIKKSLPNESKDNPEFNKQNTIRRAHFVNQQFTQFVNHISNIPNIKPAKPPGLFTRFLHFIGVVPRTVQVKANNNALPPKVSEKFVATIKMSEDNAFNEKENRSAEVKKLEKQKPALYDLLQSATQKWAASKYTVLDLHKSLLAYPAHLMHDPIRSLGLEKNQQLLQQAIAEARLFQNKEILNKLNTESVSTLISPSNPDRKVFVDLKTQPASLNLLKAILNDENNRAGLLQLFSSDNKGIMTKIMDTIHSVSGQGNLDMKGLNEMRSHILSQLGIAQVDIALLSVVAEQDRTRDVVKVAAQADPEKIYTQMAAAIRNIGKPDCFTHLQNMLKEPSVQYALETNKININTLMEKMEDANPAIRQELDSLRIKLSERIQSQHREQVAEDIHRLKQQAINLSFIMETVVDTWSKTLTNISGTIKENADEFKKRMDDYGATLKKALDRIPIPAAGAVAGLIIDKVVESFKNKAEEFKTKSAVELNAILLREMKTQLDQQVNNDIKAMNNLSTWNKEEMNSCIQAMFKDQFMLHKTIDLSDPNKLTREAENMFKQSVMGPLEKMREFKLQYYKVSGEYERYFPVNKKGDVETKNRDVLQKEFQKEVSRRVWNDWFARPESTKIDYNEKVYRALIENNLVYGGGTLRSKMGMTAEEQNAYKAKKENIELASELGKVEAVSVNLPGVGNVTHIRPGEVIEKLHKKAQGLSNSPEIQSAMQGNNQVRSQAFEVLDELMRLPPEFSELRSKMAQTIIQDLEHSSWKNDLIAAHVGALVSVYHSKMHQESILNELQHLQRYMGNSNEYKAQINEKLATLAKLNIDSKSGLADPNLTKMCDAFKEAMKQPDNSSLLEKVKTDISHLTTDYKRNINSSRVAINGALTEVKKQLKSETKAGHVLESYTKVDPRSVFAPDPTSHTQHHETKQPDEPQITRPRSGPR